MTATLTRTRPWSDQRESGLDLPRRVAIQHISDCHAKEHLLVGTHQLVGSEGPVCMTCRTNGQ